MSFSTYWASIRRNALLILGVVVVVSAGAFAYSASRPDVYDASTSVIIGPAPGLTADESINIIDTASRSTLPTSLQEVMQSDRVVTAAETASKVSPTDYTVTATAVPSSMLVLVSVSGPDPVAVKRLADAVASEGMKQFVVYFPQVGVSTVAPANVPTSKTSPKPVRDVLLAAVAALIVGMLIGLGRDSVRRDRAVAVQGTSTPTG